MLNKNWLAAFTASFVLGVSAASAANTTLTEPTDDAMCLLYYKLAKLAPPLDDFAAHASSVQRANEFDKQHSLEAEKGRLIALQASLLPVTTVTIALQMNFGEYDSTAGEYDLSGFDPSQFVIFECFGQGQVRLRFDNASDAQRWMLDSKAAEAVLTKDPDRTILAQATVDLSDVDATGPDEPPMMVGIVREVTVTRQFFNTPLGHYLVATN